MTDGGVLWTTELKDPQAGVERVVGGSVIVAHGESESGAEPSVVVHSPGGRHGTVDHRGDCALQATTTSGSTLVIVGGSSGNDDLVAIDLGP